MKKIIFILLISLISSCTSDWTCTCVYQQQEFHSETFNNVSRQKAISSCNATMQAFQVVKPGTVCIVPN